MPEHQRQYFAFLLRIWKTDCCSTWRASLESADDYDVVGFSSLVELFDYLQKILEDPVRKDLNHS